MSWRAKSCYFFARQLIPQKCILCSQGIARVALVEEWPFYPGPVSPCHINGTRNAVGGVLFFGPLILMQNLFNIGKQSKGNYYCFQIWYQQRNGDISACKHLSLLFNWATHWNKKNPFFRLFTISRWLLKVLLRQFFFCSYFPPFHASIYLCGIYNCIDWNILHKYKLTEAEDQNPFWFW